MSLGQRAKNTGCLGLGMYALGLFFALGGLVSFLNIDLFTAIQGAVLAALCFAGGIWFARRNLDRLRRSPGTIRRDT